MYPVHIRTRTNALVSQASRKKVKFFYQNSPMEESFVPSSRTNNDELDPIHKNTRVHKYIFAHRETFTGKKGARRRINEKNQKRKKRKVPEDVLKRPEAAQQLSLYALFRGRRFFYVLRAARYAEVWNRTNYLVNYLDWWSPPYWFHKQSEGCASVFLVDPRRGNAIPAAESEQ